MEMEKNILMNMLFFWNVEVHFIFETRFVYLSDLEYGNDNFG